MCHLRLDLMETDPDGGLERMGGMEKLASGARRESGFRSERAT
jgi:hypothetical protein